MALETVSSTEMWRLSQKYFAVADSDAAQPWQLADEHGNKLCAPPTPVQLWWLPAALC